MVVLLSLLAAAMPMLLEALEEPPLEEDDTLHCMAAIVTFRAFVVLLL